MVKVTIDKQSKQETMSTVTRPKEALIVARSHNSYEDFFGERLHTRMSSPVHIQGCATMTVDMHKDDEDMYQNP
ncbi:hypothetical protein OUZ56_030481 [Daphnia magna]|uniref:Uncharacterized protein n=1 Tax=Daphnia magna TaxID=35525 RepID=A0ABQ9ZSQ0_9CRUS|nr:hypothetical protein OUZ56_030481 [Daphnia magna]